MRVLALSHCTRSAVTIVIAEHTVRTDRGFYEAKRGGATARLPGVVMVSWLWDCGLRFEMTIYQQLLRTTSWRDDRLGWQY